VSHNRPIDDGFLAHPEGGKSPSLTAVGEGLG
jgi:hypothetical protein